MPLGFSRANKRHKARKRSRKVEDRNLVKLELQDEISDQISSKVFNSTFVDKMSRPRASHKKFKTRQKTYEENAKD